MTEYHRTGWLLKSTSSPLMVLEDRESKVKVPADSVSGETPGSV